MHRTHKIRVNPTSEQKRHFRQACGIARFVYNWGLAQWNAWRERGEKVSVLGLKKEFNAIRGEQFPWTYEVTKCAVDTGFMNLGRAFDNFFRDDKRVKETRQRGDLAQRKFGYPRFKSKKRSKRSFRLDRARFQVDGHWLKIQKLDSWINMAEHLRLEGELVSLTISEYAGHWYASIVVKVKAPAHEHEGAVVGIDLGVKTLAVLSDGQQYENQVLLRTELRRLKRLNRELSRRQPGSRRWRRTQGKLQRLHARVKHKRQDYLHKMTTQIARTYRLIGVEDLHVSGLLKNHCLALSIADAGFGEIRRQLGYKAEWYGGQVVVVDRFFPSSKTCSRCGFINRDLSLHDREWLCPACGTHHDRDLNASQNIEAQAIQMVAGVASSTPLASLRHRQREAGKTHVDGT